MDSRRARVRSSPADPLMERRHLKHCGGERGLTAEQDLEPEALLEGALQPAAQPPRLKAGYRHDEGRRLVRDPEGAEHADSLGGSSPERDARIEGERAHAVRAVEVGPHARSDLEPDRAATPRRRKRRWRRRCVSGRRRPRAPRRARDRRGRAPPRSGPFARRRRRETRLLRRAESRARRVHRARDRARSDLPADARRSRPPVAAARRRPPPPRSRS